TCGCCRRYAGLRGRHSRSWQSCRRAVSYGQPFQQGGAEALALELIGDRESDLGLVGLQRDVRSRGDDPKLAVDRAVSDQRQALSGIGRIAQTLDESICWIASR